MPESLLSFCEPVTATSTSPWHIRSRPFTEPLKPGGGVSTPAMCGRDLRFGWDIPKVPVTPEQVALLSGVDSEGRTALCQACVAALAQR